MQPVGYLAARAIFSILQLLESRDRAFVRSESVVLAAGVAHCWAIVFALLVTNLTQATRLGMITGSHEGTIANLPSWVQRTESMVIYSMSLWWMTGMGMACLRALQIDEEMMGLPTDVCSAKIPGWLLVLQSPLLKRGLGMAMMLSCAGLFLSLLLLCCASAWMWSVVTACELSLFAVAFGFALPHAAVAVQYAMRDSRAASKDDDSAARKSLGSSNLGALSAASEAAAVGPQLCILLSIADISSDPPVWKKLLYFGSSAVFVASLAGCTCAPPVHKGIAVPPTSLEVGFVILLDLATGIAIAQSINGVPGWIYFAILAIIVVIALALCLEEIREFVMELLDPIMPLQHSANKRLPGPCRDGARMLARLLTFCCAMVVVFQSPPQEPAFPLPAGHQHGYDHSYGSGSYDGHMYEPDPDYANSYDDTYHDWDSPMVHAEPQEYNDQDWLLVRWRQQVTPLYENELLNVSAQALSVSTDTLRIIANETQHGVVLLEFNGPVSPHQDQVRNRWQQALAADNSSLASLLDLRFPAFLDTGLCYDVETIQAESDSAVEACRWRGRSNGWWHDGNLLSHDLFTNDALQCQVKCCVEYPLCEGYTWRENDKACHLRSNLRHETWVAESGHVSDFKVKAEAAVHTDSSEQAHEPVEAEKPAESQGLADLPEDSWDRYHKEQWRNVGDANAQAAYRAICNAWRLTLDHEVEDGSREEDEYYYPGMMGESMEA